MEAMGEWSASLGGMYSCTAEEADFMTQLLASYEHHAGGGSSVTHHGGGGFWNRMAAPHHHFNIMDNAAAISPFYSMEAAAASGFCFSQESTSYSAGNGRYFGIAMPNTTAATTATMANSNIINNNNNDGSPPMDLGMEDVTINTSSYLVCEETSECNGEEYSGVAKNSGNTTTHHHMQLEQVVESHDENLELQVAHRHNADLNKSNAPCESSRKRPRATSADGNQKNKRNTRARRNQKNTETNNGGGEEEDKKEKNKAVLKRQNSTATCCSEDDSNASNHDGNGGGRGDASSSKGGDSQSVNLKGKTRASRGAATDPQSLYARKRRERINERLRILQNLVPNGTKVDISTMLEEAVHYVKFLQLQIKLLSSDDLWMYAPIAYNGMDLGLDLKLKTQQR